VEKTKLDNIKKKYHIKDDERALDELRIAFSRSPRRKNLPKSILDRNSRLKLLQQKNKEYIENKMVWSPIKIRSKHARSFRIHAESKKSIPPNFSEDFNC